MPSFLNGYEIMWVMVMFDLPVSDPEERKAATRFREFLLDEGYYMGQFSVYFKIISGREALEGIHRSIKDHLPSQGKVDVVAITDKQYKDILSFSGTKAAEKPNWGDQFFLF